MQEDRSQMSWKNDMDYGDADTLISFDNTHTVHYLYIYSSFIHQRMVENKTKQT